MRTHRGKAKNGSRGRACCFVDFDDFSQVARSSRAEVVVAQRSEFVEYARNETHKRVVDFGLRSSNSKNYLSPWFA